MHRALILVVVVPLFACLPGCFVGPPLCSDAVILIKRVTPAMACLDISAHFIGGGPPNGPFLRGKNNCSESLTLFIPAGDAGVSDSGASDSGVPASAGSQTFAPGATINFATTLGATIDGTLGKTRIQIELASDAQDC